MRKKNNWRKSLSTHSGPNTVEETIDPVEDALGGEEDLEFIKEYGNFSGFLLENIEDNYSKKIIKTKELLPIKLKDGSLKFMSEDIVSEAESEEPLEELVTQELKNDSIEEIEGDSHKKKSKVQISEEIAHLATEIIQDPQRNISNLEKLREFTKSKHIKVVKLGLLSLLMVFKDIIPGYRIRMQETDTVSKEVKMTRSFENTLLENYQEYLKDLEGYTKNLELKLVGIQCLTELLKKVPHFNFRNNLLNVVIGFMGAGKEISVLCCNCIAHIFKEDESGEISLEATKIMAKMIKLKGYKVSEQVISTFLNLRLIKEFSNEPSQSSEIKKNKRNGDHISRKSRKVIKYNEEIQKELKEAEAVYDKDEKKKMQSETLKFVFATYFRILKNAPTSVLLSAVLEGLAKFSHLINVEFFNDLLNVLKKISNDHFTAYLDGNDKRITTKNALHCVIAAFQLLSGQGEALNIDLAEFYKSFYSQMISVIMKNSSLSPILLTDEESQYIQPSRKSELELLLQGFQLMFDRKKSMPLGRVAAFVKRLATISLYMPRNAILASLSMIKSLLIKFPKLDVMFDSEGGSGNGVYSPFLDDPDLSNACSTNLWELTQLKTHYDPLVRSFVENIMEMTTIRYQSGNVRPRNPELSLSYSTYLQKYDLFIKDGREFNMSPLVPSPELIQFLKKKKSKGGIKYCDGPTGLISSGFLTSLSTTLSIDSEFDRFRNVLYEIFQSQEKELDQLRLSKVTSDKLIKDLEFKITTLEAQNIQKNNHIEDLTRKIDKFQSFKKSIQASLESQDENRNPFSEVSDNKSEFVKPGKTSIDGRSFFAKARSKLNYDEYTWLVQMVKCYNDREQSSISTLKDSSTILSKHPDLFKEFERLLSSSKIST